MNKIVEYIRSSSTKTIKNKKEYQLFNKVVVILKDQVPEFIDLNLVLKTIERTIPERLVYELDSIYIGDFKELNDRNIESLYLDGAILLTNQQESEDELIKTLIHEIAHNAEKAFTKDIYSDGALQQEFLNKRTKIFNLLKQEGFSVSLPVFMSIDFSEEFDEFIYQTVGYDRIAALSSTIFISPYGITSLREYFANGFEHYFSGDADYLRQISPKLYQKIIQLTKK